MYACASVCEKVRVVVRKLEINYGERTGKVQITFNQDTEETPRQRVTHAGQYSDLLQALREEHLSALGS